MSYINDSLDLIYEEILLYHFPERKESYEKALKNGSLNIDHILQNKNKEYVDPYLLMKRWIMMIRSTTVMMKIKIHSIINLDRLRLNIFTLCHSLKINLPKMLLKNLRRTFCAQHLNSGNLHRRSQVELDKYLRVPNKEFDGKNKHPETRKRWAQTSKAPEPLEYKLHEKPETIDFYNQLGVVQDLPFNIERTKNGNIPVYRRFRQGRDVKRTEIRKITGDVDVSIHLTSGLC